MRRSYIKPMLEMEELMLNASIAANCTNIVTIGPEDPTHPVCEEFRGRDDVIVAAVLASSESESAPVSFYDKENGGTCTCYYTSGAEGYYTS